MIQSDKGFVSMEDFRHDFMTQLIRIMGGVSQIDATNDEVTPFTDGAPGQSEEGPTEWITGRVFP